MTDLIKQTKKLVNRIEWQEVPEDLDLDDMCDFILDAIEHFYVMAGKSAEYSEDLVVLDEDGKPQYFLFVRFGQILCLTNSGIFLRLLSYSSLIKSGEI